MADPYVQVVDKNILPLGFDTSTSFATAIGLGGLAGAAIPAGANQALIQVTGDNLRWRDDGTAPTASVGMLLAAGDDFWYSGDLTTIQLIETGTTSVLNVSFYRTWRSA